MLRRLRLAPAGLLTAAAALAATGSAHAALLTTTAQSCPATQDVQAFLPWGDLAEYFLAPNGNFATGGAGWSLSGGATAVAGGDGYSLAGAPVSTESLALPDGSSATSPAVCIAIDAPTIRFFAENSGSASSTLQVTATAQTSLGPVTVAVGDVAASGTWNPTSILPILFSDLTIVPGNPTAVTFTFTPQGQGGNWQIDDFYVDPFMRSGGGG
ncbi:hypothetical protein [Conexibacter sp. DBS9H8]|uniref:hypothetical protein n=1 Tax=Conexibacter sp. DBS9H8 TaxID=2937801 RepID=UPI00200F5F9E|nr:hypothetical protein [Conexibacter sp. DBS9H8]